MIERNITALKERAAEARKQAFQPVTKGLIESAFIFVMTERGFENHTVNYCAATKEYIVMFEGVDITMYYDARDTWQAESKFWIASDELFREVECNIGDPESLEDVRWTVAQGILALSKIIKLKV